MISLSRAWTANTVHDFTARPSMRTVQAPQWVVWPVALEGCLRPRGLDGSETDAGEADPDLVAGATGAERELRRHGDCGEVADLALELEVGAPAAGRWNRHADLHEDLIGLERGR